MSLSMVDRQLMLDRWRELRAQGIDPLLAAGTWTNSAGELKGGWFDVDFIRSDGLTDAEYVHDMLIEIPDDLTPASHMKHNCRHFDETTMSCTAYDARPRMCRLYPYGRECDRPGCTFTNEKEWNESKLQFNSTT